MCAIIEWLCVQRERKRMHQCVLATTEWLCVQRERERKRRLQCVLSLNVVCVKRKRRHHSDMVMDVCMVNIELAETAAVSDGTSSVTQPNSAVRTPLGWIFKTRYKSYSHSFRITCDKRAVSLLESGEQAISKRSSMCTIIK